jgi:hypothetical protein
LTQDHPGYRGKHGAEREIRGSVLHFASKQQLPQPSQNGQVVKSQKLTPFLFYASASPFRTWIGAPRAYAKT